MEQSSTALSWSLHRLAGWYDAAALCEVIDRKSALSDKPYDPALCLNCFEPIESTNPLKLYCSRACAQTAEKVRELRRWRKTNGDFDIHEMLATVSRAISIAFSGGYDKRTRQIKPDIRQFIIERAGLKCEQCGVPFGDGSHKATIQHMRGSSNDPSDLRAWCWQCNTLGPLRIVSAEMLRAYSPEQLERLQYSSADNADALCDPELEIVLREIDLRVKADEPICRCDSERWDPKHFQDERRVMQSRTQRRRKIKSRAVYIPNAVISDRELCDIIPSTESEYDDDLDVGEYIRVRGTDD